MMKDFRKKTGWLVLIIFLFFTSCVPNSKKSGQLLDKGIEYYYHAQYPEAYKLFKQSIEVNDRSFEAWFWLGNYYENFGKHKKAIEAFNKTIELNPKFADAYANRAGVKKNLGDKAGACADYKKAAALGKPNLDDHLKMCD